MIDPNSFDGGLRFGPQTFVGQTGRNKVWAAPRELVCNQDRTECPTCGSCDRRVLFGKNPTYGCCSVCGMIYATTVPTDKDLLDYYRNGPAPKCWAEHVQQHPLELMLDKLKFRWELELVGWPQILTSGLDDESDSLCDVGCSTGTLIETALEMHAEIKQGKYPNIVGIDVNHGALELARSRTEELAKAEECSLRFREASEPDPRYSRLIVLWEVLEHVIDPNAMMKEVAFRVPQGPCTVLICVPNAHSLAAKVLHEKAPMFGMGHFNIWGPSTLQMFLQRHLPDFTVEYRSIISWAKELTNHYRFKGPFDDDPEIVAMDPAVILKNLEGYKLVAIARRA